MDTVFASRGSRFIAAVRINGSLTASLEKRLLVWMAARTPHWITSDGLTLLGLAAQVLAGVFYGLVRWDRRSLLAVIACVALNWLGDSLDGTLARVRGQQRPRYGFYVDHVVDTFGSVALMTGLAASGMVHWQVPIAMLVAFLLLAGESYLATYTLGRFEMSQGIFGPTEIRLLLIVGNMALLRTPFCTILGHRLLLFDVGGCIAAVIMGGMVVWTAMRHTRQLYREEPLL